MAFLGGRRSPLAVRAVLVGLVAILAAACSTAAEPAPQRSTADSSAESPTTAPTPSATGPTVVADNLAVPWSVAVLPDGSALVTHRDTAAISHITPGGATEQVGTVAGVVPGEEGGLLGIAAEPGANPESVWVYFTAAGDNRVARLDWNGTRLSRQREVLTGIPKAATHNGGRIAFGPDGFLYVATGDTRVSETAQDPVSLAGKILRITRDGEPAPGNPDPGSAVWSLGHRNVQGLAWDPEGRLWASEFGEVDVDELNLIEPGGNYGWPVCEGPCDKPGFTDPAATWSPTATASPSGLAIADGSAWVAGLRGEVLWQVPLDGDTAGEPVAHFEGEYGRLRDVVLGPDPGTLWIVTNNTDGRGDPRDGDDRIVAIPVP